MKGLFFSLLRMRKDFGGSIIHKTTRSSLWGWLSDAWSSGKIEPDRGAKLGRLAPSGGLINYERTKRESACLRK